MALPKISLSVNVLSQSLAMILQVLNAMMTTVPEKDKPYVAAGIAIVQAVVAYLAHYSPPPGTSA